MSARNVSRCRGFPDTIEEQSPTAIRSSRDSFTIMPRLRRLTAVLCSLLLVQLTLLDGYRSCAPHARPQEHGSAEMTAVMHGSRALAAAAASTDGCDTEHLPSACSAMSACVSTLGLPTSGVAGEALLPAPMTLPEPVAIHSQPLAAPDAPPPRG